MPPPDPNATLGSLAKRAAPGAIFLAVVTGAWWTRRPPPIEPAPEPAPTVVLSGETMGTTWTVKIVGESAVVEQEALAALVQGELDAVNAGMSTWLPESELSRLNAAERTMPISTELQGVLELARRVHEASGGAFDVTVGPLVNAWGFGPDGRALDPPDEAALSSLMERVGQAKLQVSDGVATKDHPGLYVDLSAVAKGYGVDQVARALEGASQPVYMVEVGGEIRVGQAKPDGEPWRLAIEQPDAQGREVNSSVPLTGQSMATSGDYRNFIGDGASKRSHTIDPRTGRPVEHGLASVTVLAPRCDEADAWATALMVLGPEEGLRVAEAEVLAARFLVRSEGGFTALETSAFSKSAPAVKTVDPGGSP